MRLIMNVNGFKPVCKRLYRLFEDIDGLFCIQETKCRRGKPISVRWVIIITPHAEKGCRRIYKS